MADLDRGKVQRLAEEVAEAILRAHESFARLLLGPNLEGMSPSHVQSMIAAGVLDPKRIAVQTILPGGTEPMDPMAFALLLAQEIESLPPEERFAAYNAPLAEMVPRVEERWRQSFPPGGGTGQPSWAPMTIAPPQGMTGTGRESWLQARHRAGEFIRGLGNVVGQATAAAVEEWDGESIVRDVDRTKRLRLRETVRREVADAIEHGTSERKLASNLHHASEDWARDFERIARTELQGAYSEGVVLDSAREDGPDGLIARIPEPGACDDCERVFMIGAYPRVFRTTDLVANGTNVGRKRGDWQATVWPIHPNCRCSTISVPEGYRPDKSGRLRRLDRGGRQHDRTAGMIPLEVTP